MLDVGTQTAGARNAASRKDTRRRSISSVSPLSCQGPLKDIPIAGSPKGQGDRSHGKVYSPIQFFLRQVR